MAPAETYLLQFYRQSPGDLRIVDLEHRDRGTIDAILKDCLLLLYNNRNIADDQRPIRARAISLREMSVICVIEVISPTTVKRI